MKRATLMKSEGNNAPAAQEPTMTTATATATATATGPAPYAVTYLDDDGVRRIWTGGLSRSAAYAEDVDARTMGLAGVLVMLQSNAEAVNGLREWDAISTLRQRREERKVARQTIRTLLSRSHPLEGYGRLQAGELAELAGAYRVVARTSSCPDHELAEAARFDALAKAFVYVRRS